MKKRKEKVERRFLRKIFRIEEKEKDTPRIKKLKYDAKNESIKEGIFNSGRVSFADNYFSPFAIAINASNALVASMSAISGLLGPISQVFGSKMIESHPRKKIILKAILFQSLMLLPIMILAFLYYKNIITGIIPVIFIIFFSFYMIFTDFGHPAWFSWIGDLVNEKSRGKYFSKRKLILEFTSLILAITSAIFLDYIKKKNWIMFGFIILFALALISNIFRWKTFKKEYEPQLKIEPKEYFSFLDFIIKAPTNNFGRFTIFRALLGFASTISNPLLAIYLLRFLEFNYLTYMIITFSGTFFSLAILELWGKFADKYGNYKVLQITCVLIPIVPIIWILSPSKIYLIFVPAVIGGISWAGFNLAAANFVYDCVTPQKRGFAISYYNMLHGIGIFIGALLSALLIKYVNVSFTEPIFLIFLLGGVARMLVVFFWLPKLKEIRKTGKIRSSKAIRDIIVKQGKSTFFQEIHEIRSIKKYLFK